MSDADPAPVIEAEALVKRYGELVAVKAVSFRIDAGDVFGFLGPNGAGKTTIMRVIQCISPRSGGSVSVFGMDPEKEPRRIKQQIGVVPQETNLDTEFTCYENLLVYSRYFGIPGSIAKERIERLLDFVALQEKRDVKIDQLSGGMKRRLLLARALVNDPSLLILDEPTIGLDPQARHLIWEKLKQLQAEGNTIVLTTHYLEEAERLCNRLAIIDNGKTLVEGSPDALIANYVGTDIVEAENTAGVIACLDDLDARYEIVGDMVQVFTDEPRALAGQLFEECNPGRVFARRATLEDVFLQLTGRNLRE
ncbi:MAG: ATP-binding cassette domain-containing protein [Methanomicrobiaceae archaeon]|nr:ATP-binding cassette domain-containing protein [Methanomicrobiaceae archaeon]